MSFLRIIWPHGHEKAEEFIRTRKRLRFMITTTGEVVDGYLVSIQGEGHAMVEVRRKRLSKLRRRMARHPRPHHPRPHHP